jgi:hypothetical protein
MTSSLHIDALPYSRHAAKFPERIMSLALLVDTASIFSFRQSLEGRDFPLQSNINYAALLDALHLKFPDQEFDPKLAFVAIDPENEGQKKFINFLQHQKMGFMVEPCDYRDAFILPDRASHYQRLSTRVTYVAGMLARQHPHLVVVTDAFDVYYPLLDYVEVRSGEVSLAFFRSGLESRWHRTGIFDRDSKIGFVDLDPYAKAIIGGDLVSTGPAIERRGMANIKT